MNINWKVRLRHPAFYTALVGLVGLIVTDIGLMELGRFETYAQLLMLVLISGGVISDLTTEGLADSDQALNYDKPKPKEDKDNGDFY